MIRTYFLSSMQSKNISWEPQALPHSYKLREIDIVCGRGKGSWDHEGNRRFRMMIERHAERYATAKNKFAKTEVVSSVVEMIRGEGILFVKADRERKQWQEIGRQEAQKKTGHAIRDHLAKREKSANASNGQGESITSYRRSGNKVKEASIAATKSSAHSNDLLKSTSPSKLTTSSHQQLIEYMANHPQKHLPASLTRFPNLPDNIMIPQGFSTQDMFDDDAFSQQAFDVLSRNQNNKFAESQIALNLEDFEDKTIASCSSLSIDDVL